MDTPKNRNSLALILALVKNPNTLPIYPPLDAAMAGAPLRMLIFSYARYEARAGDAVWRPRFFRRRTYAP